MDTSEKQLWRSSYSQNNSPNENFSYAYIHLKPVRTEAQENVVMRFGENLIDMVEVMAKLLTDRLRLKDFVRRMAHGASVQLESPNMSAYGTTI